VVATHRDRVRRAGGDAFDCHAASLRDRAEIFNVVQKS
jgi:hypothetical protein